LSIGNKTDCSASAARAWAQVLARYRKPSLIRSVVELAITALPLAALWAAAWFVYSLGYWWASLLLAIPAAGFLVRLFMIQHDCGHGAFFPCRWANDWCGRVIGFLTMTPYDFWRRAHAVHHATSGNLGLRGIGDIDTLTVREFIARSSWGRLKYRLYRSPVIMFGFGPAYLFLLQHRLPVGFMRDGWRPWVSTQTTNTAIVLIATLLIYLIGIKAFLLIHMPIMLLAATFGVWLFYVQHQFENTFWSESRSWNLHEAALHGSSHYDLPVLLRWFSANIGIHHVHHLCSRIPYYRLTSALHDYPELRDIGRLSMMQSLYSVRLVLWDEAHSRLVSFREAQRSIQRAQ
jgi:omega-6 fatty acid desaturase (delta-12 desaturase)